MAQYQCGNCLRGHFFGEFESDEGAWAVLSDRFNKAYPSRSGREVELIKTIRVGRTAGGNETERDRLLREKIEAAIARGD